MLNKMSVRVRCLSAEKMEVSCDRVARPRPAREHTYLRHSHVQKNTVKQIRRKAIPVAPSSEQSVT